MYKTAIKIMGSVSLMVALQCCSPSPEQIQASAGELMAVNHGIDSVYNQLTKSYETFQASEMDNALAGMVSYLDGTIATMRSMNTPDDCKKLHKAISDKIEVMRSIAATEAKEQVRIYKIPDSDFTDELRHKWDDISKRVEQKVSEANDIVSKANKEIKQNNQK